VESSQGYVLMKIKICGLFRDEDVDYVNEALPDFAGFVFAPSKRQVSPAQAASLRRRLAEAVTTAGVFVNTPVGDISALYRGGVISVAQLNGNEAETYISRLKDESAKDGRNPVQVIKVIRSGELEQLIENKNIPSNVDYYLIDSGAGSGLAFDWKILNPGTPCAEWLETTGKPWFLAGGINADNIEKAIALKPFCIDVSGGAETDGIKNREKILLLTSIVRKENRV
jgi:phosphoribosylanthranilate isomerase